MHYACLIVGHDAEPSHRLQRELGAFDFKPHSVASCDEALALMQHWSFDAIVIDAESFGPHYLAALKRLRQRSRSPLIVLARAQDEASQLVALESGASDIVVLPASARLISAKLRRLIEAGNAPRPETIEVSVGPLAMNARRGTAIVGDHALVLTVHQFELLFLLATRLGEFVHRETIWRVLQGRAACTGRSVDVHVSRIRKSLRAIGVAGLRLDTIHGRGYCLSFEPETAADRITDGLAYLGSGGASDPFRGRAMADHSVP